MPTVRDLFVQDAISCVVALEEKLDVADEVLAEAVVDIGFLDSVATPEHNFKEEFKQALVFTVLHTVQRELRRVRVTFLTSKRL